MIIMKPKYTGIPLIYKDLCPVCGKDVTTEELECGICENTNKPFSSFLLPEGYEEFSDFFERRTGSSLKSVQKYWAKKLLAGLSFAAVAPTGVGKTLFGLIYSAFLAEKNRKCYIVVPTTLLLRQSYEKLLNITSKRILAFLPRMKEKEKSDFFEKLQNAEFDILITTAAFLSKHFEKMNSLSFDFIFVDDVDAVLKASKNIERLLFLLSFSEKEIKTLVPDASKKHGQIMVSTATARPGKKAMLFARLLGFYVGSSRQVLRNVDDYGLVCKNKDDKLKTVSEILQKLGYGGLVFTNSEKDAKDLFCAISEKVRCGLILSSLSKKEIDETVRKFLDRELNLLIGVATPYGLLVRGIDYPSNIRYAVFYSVPHFQVGVREIEEASPKMLLMLASIFRKDERLEKYIPYILRNEDIREKARKVLVEIFQKKEFEKAMEGVVVEENSILLPDISTYIQASGRTSRLFAGGITKGVSFVIDTPQMLSAFKTRASYYDISVESLDCNQLGTIDFERMKRELELSRREYTLATKNKDVITPALFIVESPTKAKQIARFFGRPAMFSLDDQMFYEITTGSHVLVIGASLGHVTDLVENEYYHGVKVENGSFIPIYSSIKKCRDDNTQFVNYQTCPRCGKQASYDSRARILNFVKVAGMTGNVILATDPDTEGEKIAFDLKNFTGTVADVKRAEFHEVTRNAVIRALNQLRSVNENMVKAQIIRRVEDRWIGFELSSVLQKRFEDKNLSAGRAQTPVMSWIIKRYYEHMQKEKVFLLKIDDRWITLGTEDELKIKLDGRFGRFTVSVDVTSEKKEERTPSPPYTTDTALRDINRLLKINTRNAMKILQELFENGIITYHRTDSTRVSDKGLEVARQYLKEDFVAREWKIGNEGAHECIRPTRPLDWKILRDLVYQGLITVYQPLGYDHFRVYDLVFRRFMSSQCPKIKATTITYEINVEELNISKRLKITCGVEGRAYELYPYGFRMEKPLPEGMKEGTVMYVLRRKAELFTQADVISLMKERGIGRPSTYATLLEKLFKRRYIFEKNSRLIPTKRGMKVEEFLSEKYRAFVSEKRTRFVEELMDEVETGRAEYMRVLGELYREIKSVINHTK